MLRLLVLERMLTVEKFQRTDHPIILCVMKGEPEICESSFVCDSWCLSLIHETAKFSTLMVADVLSLDCLIHLHNDHLLDPRAPSCLNIHFSPDVDSSI